MQALASKYGFVRVTESADLNCPPTLEKNIFPWRQPEAASHWEELRTHFGYAPWDVLAAGGNFIPAGLAERLRDKIEVKKVKTNEKKRQPQAGIIPSSSPAKVSKKTAGGASSPCSASPAKKGRVQEASPLRDSRTPKKSSSPLRGSQTSKKNPSSEAQTRGASASPQKARRAYTSEVEECLPLPEAPASANKENDLIIEMQGAIAGDPSHKSEGVNGGGMQLENSQPASVTVEEVPALNVKLKHPVEAPNFAVLSPSTEAQQQDSVATREPEVTDSGARAEGGTRGSLFSKELELQEASKPSVSGFQSKATTDREKQMTKQPQSQPPRRKFDSNTPRQLKLTDLLRLTLNKVKGKVNIAINSDALRTTAEEPEDEPSDTEFMERQLSKRRRLIDDDAPVEAGSTQPHHQHSASLEAAASISSRVAGEELGEAATALSQGGDPEVAGAQESTPYAEHVVGEEEAQRQAKRKQKELRRKERAEALRKQRRLERKKQAFFR